MPDEAIGVAQAFERGGGCVGEGCQSGLQEVEEFGVVALGEEGVVGSCGDATVAGGKCCGGEWAAANLLDGNAEDGWGLRGVGEFFRVCKAIDALVRTTGIFCINGTETRNDSLFLMDISYINAEFKKYRSQQVDGVLGTDFLEKHKAIIDYSRSALYLKANPDGKD